MSVVALQVNRNPSAAKHIVLAVQEWLMMEVIGNKPYKKSSVD